LTYSLEVNPETAKPFPSTLTSHQSCNQTCKTHTQINKNCLKQKKKIIVRGKRKEKVTVRTELRDKEERGIVLDGVLELRRDRERIKILVSEAGVVLLLNPSLSFASLDIFPGRVFFFFCPVYR